jgi:hypothetical protein
VRLERRQLEEFSDRAYRAVCRALQESWPRPEQGIEALDGEKYQERLRTSLEGLLGEVLAAVTCGPQATISIFVAYLRSSLLYYDGRIDLYLRGTWGSTTEEADRNIEIEQQVNRVLWRPGHRPAWSHMLELLGSRGIGRLVAEGEAGGGQGVFQADDTVLPMARSVAAASKLGRLTPSEPRGVAAVLEHLLGALDEDDVRAAAQGLLGGIGEDKLQRARRLLVNPTRVMAAFRLPHLVYLPLSYLSTPNAIGTAALDGGCVLAMTGPRAAEARDLPSLLGDIREAVRDCLAVPLLCAENRLRARERAGEETYYARFYGENPPVLGEALEDARRRWPQEAAPLFEEVNRALKDLVRTEVRGWRSVAGEMYDCVAGIWRSWGIDAALPGPERGESLLALLHRMLDFQEQLKYLPKYREHFVHSFHVLAVGMALVASLPLFEHWRRDEAFWKAWFIAALYHDIGVPIARAPEAVERVIRSDFRLASRDQALRPDIKWHNLLIEKTFHRMLQEGELEKLLTACTPDGMAQNRRYLYTDSRGRRYDYSARDMSHWWSERIAGGSDGRRFDHGLLSGLLLYQHSERARDASWKGAVRAAIIPVMLHDAWEDIVRRIRVRRGFYCDPRDGFLAYLLTLCDTICQQGRSFTKQQEDADPAINFARFAVQGQQVNVCLDYSAWDQKPALRQQRWDRYVAKPTAPFVPRTGQDGSPPVVEIVCYSQGQRVAEIQSVIWQYVAP